MFTLTDFPNVKFINFESEDKVNQFVYGDGTNPPKPLYKYAKWEFAKKSLQGRYLWMSNPSKWIDPFEDYFFKADYIDANGNHYLFPFLNNVFCNCFTPDHNSEAHWITYSQKEIGVSLRINVPELLERLNNFGLANPEYKIYIGKVSYIKLSQIQSQNINNIPLYEDRIGPPMTRNINDPDFCANLLLLKRNSFKHDNEIRLIFIKTDDMFSSALDGIKFEYNYDNSGSKIKYHNDKLISRVFTSPFHDTTVRDGIRFELEKPKYGIRKYPVKRSSGIVSQYSRIQRSRLYDKVEPRKIII